MDEELQTLDAIGGRTLDPLSLSPEQRNPLQKSLVEMFGQPSSPAIQGDPATMAAVAELGLTQERLLEGGLLYRRYCLQCHGLTGDGRGPTGPWVYPQPRDFRRGSFKFTSTGDSAKPRREDLIRTIKEGLKGTAMPSFAMLPEEDRERLATYVTFLAIRGQAELQTLMALGNGEADGDSAGFVHERVLAILSEWRRAKELPARVPSRFEKRDGAEHEDSVRRGFDLFTAKSGAGCAACHEDLGRKAAYRYDVWGTVVRPADLSQNKYKSGSGDEDLFRRIRGGIAASGMPAHPTLSDAQVWDLVRFVRSAPFPRELPADVREKIEARP